MQIYKIPQELLLELITGGARIHLPEGAELGGVWVDPASETVLLRVHHPTFPHVPEGQQTPVGELIVQGWTSIIHLVAFDRRRRIKDHCASVNMREEPCKLPIGHEGDHDFR